MKTHSEAFLRKRKFLMVLPLLALPFLALAFWNLGGGKGPAKGANAQGGQKGLNLQLPEAQLKKQHQDKLSHYDQAQQKARQLSAAGTSHLLQRLGFSIGNEESQLQLTPDTTATATMAFADPQEEQLNRKLAQLEKAIQPPPLHHAAQQRKPPTPVSLPASGNDRFQGEVDRLETLMQRMGGNGTAGNDPEMQQLENMLERILDIQHPERVKQRLAHQAPQRQQQTFALQASAGQAAITLLEPVYASQAPREAGAQLDESRDTTPLSILTANAFYGLQDNYTQAGTGEAGNVLEAAIHETRTLTAGATVKIRLLQDVHLSGRRVGKGSLLYGTCRLNGERLHIEVTSVLIQDAVVPVALAAYDLDGQEGLYIPGALTRDAAKQGADRAINQSLQLSALNPGIGAQAASAGIEAAKGLLSRQARQVKVTVNAGHRLLLRDQSIRR
ncbi:conjugative transposon protein TraM [Pontibacter qinzhouensis]|uniref:Conjugative transposon protein TraM n=1 Tax=Pontibacter qinzhouensis TaxID=2603253 RepID=A0A5C8J4M0_9BACT|nr:conjugative transposon protein TraM [Pontibacter qinzhouensis]TXK31124.1 conjugative transposon protein TraM [Pontibacter qinzhouensis]